MAMSDSTTNPLFDENFPPLLANNPISLILNNKLIAGETTVTDAVAFFSIAHELVKNGCQIIDSNNNSQHVHIEQMFTMDFIGFVNNSGNKLFNVNRVALPSDAIHSAPTVSKVYQTLEWHLTRPPETYSRDTKDTKTTEFSTELTDIESFSNELEQSLEASAGYSGFGAEVKVTLGLKSTAKESHEQQRRAMNSTKEENEITELAGHTYADWVLYNKVEVEYTLEKHPYASSFTNEQIAVMVPSKKTYYLVMQVFGDSEETAKIPKS
jgi:hypothetical protein